MVRCYKSVGKKKQWSSTNLFAAVEAVNRHGSSKNRAAIEYGIPRQTLNRYLKLSEQERREMAIPVNTVFSRQQEEELLQYLLDMDKRLYGLTLRELRSVAFQLAERKPYYQSVQQRNTASRVRLGLRIPQTTPSTCFTDAGTNINC